MAKHYKVFHNSYEKQIETIYSCEIQTSSVSNSSTVLQVEHQIILKQPLNLT